MTRLMISQSFPEDEGEYTCHVQNTFGSDAVMAYLLVVGESIVNCISYSALHYLCSVSTNLTISENVITKFLRLEKFSNHKNLSKFVKIEAMK